MVGLVLPAPAVLLPATLTGLSGKGYRAAKGRDDVLEYTPGLSDPGGAAGEMKRDGKPLRPRAVGVVGLLDTGESGSVRSLTTVSLSTLTSDRSRARGVVWLLAGLAS